MQSERRKSSRKLKISAPGEPGDGAARGVRRLESERRRARILEAARGCFGRLGFTGATVEAIAGEAGVSNGLLYQFFRSKEHLLGVVLEELVRDWARALAAGEREPSATAALEAVFRGAVDFARGNPLLSLDKLTRVQDRIAKSRPGNLQLVLAISRRIVRTKESARY